MGVLGWLIHRAVSIGGHAGGRRGIAAAAVLAPQATLALLLALLALLATLATLGGCMQPAPLRPPLATMAPAALGLVTTQATPEAAPDWWQAWGDATLNQLVAQALAGQPGLQAAAARLARAEALARGVDAAAAPQLAFTADVTVQRYTEVGLVPPAIAGSTRTSANLQAGGSWSLDLNGRQAAELQAAIGQQRAAALELQAARSLLATQVVRAHVALARLQAQRQLAGQQLTLRQQMLALVQQRARAGLDNATDLRQAEAPLPDLRGQAEALDEQILLARHQLAALTGQAPDALAALQAPLLGLKPPALPQRLGTDLLGRRPEVLAARWRVEAAGQDVASARAQFYPDVNLAGFVGLNALGLQHLVDLGARNLGGGPALRLPLFDGGRLQAQLQLRGADLDGAIAGYNLAVLDAVREAADVLGSLLSIGRQQAEQAHSQGVVEGAQALARQRQAAGIGNRLPLLAADMAVLQQQRARLDLQARQLDAQALLMRALGGGWLADPALAADPSRRPLADASAPRPVPLNPP